MKLDPEVTQTPEIKPVRHRYDEKHKDKRCANQFFSSLLEVLIAIERNTANAAENTARLVENTTIRGSPVSEEDDSRRGVVPTKDEGAANRFLKECVSPVRRGR